MITNCRSHTGNCPCVVCGKQCCVDFSDTNGMTDTEKLCDEAKEYCETCASKYNAKHFKNKEGDK